MSFELSQTIDLLQRTPRVLEALLRDSSPAWHAIDEGASTWRPIDVVGHLIHGEETDWIPRARIIFEHGESQAFEPYDRFAQVARFEGWSLARLLDRFGELRRANLETLEGWQLSPDQLDQRGRHPELGKVTLGQLLATWAAHDLGHIVQIARVMAKRHRTDVGPWRAYLGVLGAPDEP